MCSTQFHEKRFKLLQRNLQLLICVVFSFVFGVGSAWHQKWKWKVNGIWCLCKLRQSLTTYSHEWYSLFLCLCLNHFLLSVSSSKTVYKYAFRDSGNVWKLGAVGSTITIKISRELLGIFAFLLMWEALPAVDSKSLQPYKWFHIFVATTWTIAFGRFQKNFL